MYFNVEVGNASFLVHPGLSCSYCTCATSRCRRPQSWTLKRMLGRGWGSDRPTTPQKRNPPRLALQGGLEADLFLLKVLVLWNLGISTGLEYDNMTNHGIVNFPPPPVAFTINSDNNYVYLIVPFALTSRIPLSQSLSLSLRAGGFFGHFMGGQSTNITNSLAPGSSSLTFDSSNCPQRCLVSISRVERTSGWPGIFSFLLQLFSTWGLRTLPAYPLWHSTKITTPLLTARPTQILCGRSR